MEFVLDFFMIRVAFFAPKFKYRLCIEGTVNPLYLCVDLKLFSLYVFELTAARPFVGVRFYLFNHGFGVGTQNESNRMRDGLRQMEILLEMAQSMPELNITLPEFHAPTEG